MTTTALKKKLKNDFEKILKDESKLEILDTVFTEIITENETESQNLKATETQKEISSKKTEIRSWDDFQKKMKAKYGF